jgi:DNA-directed RNA polymerase omega subunit
VATECRPFGPAPLFSRSKQYLIRASFSLWCLFPDEQSQTKVCATKYRLIILAAKRSKQLQRGARPRIEIDPTEHKPTRIAVEEVIQGTVPFHSTDNDGADCWATIIRPPCGLINRLLGQSHPRDQWHARAIAASRLVAETKLITTEVVLVELLNFFSEYGEKARRGAVTQAEGILTNLFLGLTPQALCRRQLRRLIIKHYVSSGRLKISVGLLSLL